MAETETQAFKMQTIQQFIAKHGISLTAQRTDTNPNMDDGARMDHWKVTLARPRMREVTLENDLPVLVRTSAKVRMTLTFSKGIGHHGAEPTPEEVLDCLASDASGIENTRSFEDWCNEYGYDTDSRKAERIYKSCQRQTAKLRKFLEDDAVEDAFNSLVWETERY